MLGLILIGGNNMVYNEALVYLNQTSQYGSKLGLENIRYLLELLGNPQRDLNIIHIAGTNGKGSTSAFIGSILKEQGYKTGAFSSPYIENITEMIRINGDDIPREDFGEITETVKKKVDKMIGEGWDHPTEFEILTAMAFVYFKIKNTDFVTLEVGLGGRLDSTNVIEKPMLSIITPISLDHINILGNTLEEIAREKSGIIKENSPVVIWPQKKIAQIAIEEIAEAKGASLYNAPKNKMKLINYNENGASFDVEVSGEMYSNLEISMLGNHQVENAVLAISAIQVMKNQYGIELSKESIYSGLKNARWAGRLEVLGKNPTLVIDGAHNIEGAKALKKAIKETFKYKRFICVIGLLADKDIDGILDEIIPLCNEVIVTEPNNPRKLSAYELKNKIDKFNVNTLVFEDIESATYKSLEIAKDGDLVLYCGSLYLIGKVRAILKKVQMK